MGGLEFKCSQCTRNFCELDKASQWLACCSENPEGCFFYRNNPVEDAQENKQITFAETSPDAVSDGLEKLECLPGQSELQNKAASLHRRIMTNGRIAADCILEIAKDLRTMRDEKLYTYLGCEDFDRYCVQRVGFHKRQAYNFIRVLEQYGEKQLAEYSSLGIAKLVELTTLDPEDRQELIESGAAAEMSVRELKEEITRLNSRCEQLTLDIEDKSAKLKEANVQSDEMGLIKGELEKYHNLEAHYLEKIRKLEDSGREKDNAASMLKSEIESLREKNSELESRPVDVAVEKPSEEYLDSIREEARAEENKRWKAAMELKKKGHEKELVKVKNEADKQRITAVDAARKQEAAKYTAEIEKLKAENAALQSNAQKPVPTEDKALLKYRVANIQNEFNSVIAMLGSFEPEEREKCKVSLKTMTERIMEVLNNV